MVTNKEKVRSKKIDPYRDKLKLGKVIPIPVATGLTRH